MKSEKVLLVIPARAGSTRLANKPLKKIAGKELILHVAEKAKDIKKADKILVATDSQEIASILTKNGIEYMMTDPDILSGTDRVAKVAQKFDQYDIIINLQGDQLYFNPVLCDDAIDALKKDRSVDVATIALKAKRSDADTKHSVKVVCDKFGYALYFSRSMIPFDRDDQFLDQYIYKHVGIYLYRRYYLLKFGSIPLGNLESVEKLEQLRILENGDKILVITGDGFSMEIDTQEDIEKAEKVIKKI